MIFGDATAARIAAECAAKIAQRRLTLQILDPDQGDLSQNK
jgi:hypothetical protein